VFETARDESMLVGESNLADRAIGEEIEFGAGTSPDLRFVTVAQPKARKRAPFTVSVTNARSTPETFELALPPKIASASDTLIERKGRKVWRVIVPANGMATLNVAFELPR
jgi:hypothetical protein